MGKTMKVGIIGAGAAGMMAAVFTARAGADVTVFEKNGEVGKKLSITGKGRCNVTNDCDRQEFLRNVISNPKFLYAAINNFDTSDTKDFFEGLGVELKTERGRRVFPVSDKAVDIVNALKRAVKESGGRIKHEKVLSLSVENSRITGLSTVAGNYDFDAVICATGGASYPRTGSDGDGYKFAKEVGIKVTELTPSLVPLETLEDVSEIMGLSLKNVTLTVRDNETKKTVFSELGEMLFTHFGISGPLVLSASSHMHDIMAGKYTAYIDFKPALDFETLDKRILSDFSKYINKDFSNSLSSLLPSKIIPFIVKRVGISPNEKVNAITREQRKALVNLLKGMSLDIKRPRPISEAIVTSGGIDVAEINPSDMQSKKINGLYFAGEVIDVDAYTGGYNLQIAFSTGALAGKSAAANK